METVLPILVATAAVGLIVGLLLVLHRRAPLTFVQAVVPDAGGRWVHLFGARTYSPDDGDSFSVWHHVLVDPLTRAFVRGESQRGEGLDLASPFVARSLAALSARLQAKLALVRPKERRGPHEVVTRSARATDTELPEPLPDDALVMWEVSREPARFDVELREGGRSRGRWPLRGDPHLEAHCRFPDRDGRWLIVAYLRQVGLRIGGGLVVIDLERGVVVSDGFVPSRPPK